MSTPEPTMANDPPAGTGVTAAGTSIRSDAGTEFRGARVVVTGAAGGIGAAIAAGFADRGATVLINDLAADQLAETAARVGAEAVAGDAASENGVEALIAKARASLGEIDIFVANAGVSGPSGLGADEGWAQAWDVNTMAHVRAARLLVPSWLERGSGRFVVTASAAGLLTMLGGAAYAATKHAAVAFAEWLSATYAHRGLAVHAICPQGVDTAIFRESAPNAQAVMRPEGVLQPTEVAASLFAAIEADQFYALPHPRVADYYRARASDPQRWLAKMNQVQRAVDG